MQGSGCVPRKSNILSRYFNTNAHSTYSSVTDSHSVGISPPKQECVSDDKGLENAIVTMKAEENLANEFVSKATQEAPTSSYIHDCIDGNKVEHALFENTSTEITFNDLLDPHLRQDLYNATQELYNSFNGHSEYLYGNNVEHVADDPVDTIIHNRKVEPPSNAYCCMYDQDLELNNAVMNILPNNILTTLPSFCDHTERSSTSNSHISNEQPSQDIIVLSDSDDSIVEDSAPAVICLDSCSSHEDSEIIISSGDEGNCESPSQFQPRRRRVKNRSRGSVDVTGSEPVASSKCGSTCAVCLESLTGGQPVSSVPCGHCFCTTCIQEVVEKFSKCPTCNSKTDITGLHKIFL